VTYTLEYKNISKAFPGVQALDNVSFKMSGGKVTALMGENGAGKSTLLKILSGDYQPDEGKILINGEEKRFRSPHQAIKSSISIIYQERQLVNTLSVAENLFLEDLPGNRLGFINKAELRRRTQEIIDTFGLPIRPTDIVGRLSVAYQQMVEIMKAYRRDSNIIAFDEPTAPLTDKEIVILFRVIQTLKEKGKIVIYVSHRMKEIFEITDEIVVMKDGHYVKTLQTAETSEQELVRLMVGRDIGDTYANLNRNDKIGDVLLEVNNLVTDYVKDVSFKLRAGEILGFSGLVGAGRTEVMRALFGADRIISGEIKLEGEVVHFRSPRDAIGAGIALCPEDRKEQGLILGRWTSDKMVTKILILDEPTKGIDVGAKAEVYQTVCDLARQGIGVIFISSELTEVLGMSDNIIVMHNGRITGTLSREEATEERVLELAMLES
jgi:ABC-type sugar transport system ATPase subunit